MPIQKYRFRLVEHSGNEWKIQKLRFIDQFTACFFFSSIFLLDMPPINKNKDVGKKVFSYWNSFKIRWGSIFPFFNTYNNQKPWYIMDLLFRTGLWSVILSQDTLALLPPNSRKIKIKEKLGKGFFFSLWHDKKYPAVCCVFGPFRYILATLCE